jgi:hypothetical protein
VLVLLRKRAGYPVGRSHRGVFHVKQIICGFRSPFHVERSLVPCRIILSLETGMA